MTNRYTLVHDAWNRLIGVYEDDGDSIAADSPRQSRQQLRRQGVAVRDEVAAGSRLAEAVWNAGRKGLPFPGREWRRAGLG